MLSDALGNGAIGFLDTLPAVVAIHRIIAAGNRSNTADLNRVDLRLQAVDIFDTGLRGRVAAVHEAMEAHLAQTVAARQLEQREHMVNMRVYAAIGQQAENMQLNHLHWLIALMSASLVKKSPSWMALVMRVSS